MAEQQEQPAEKKTSPMEVVGMILGGLMIVAACARAYEWITSDSSEADTSSAVDGAEQIIRNNMRSPDSYQRRSADVVWKGSTQAGNKAFGVKVDYNGQNGFGATIRNCEYIFYFRDGDELRWHETYGREPCDAVQYFTNEAELATTMGKKLGELAANKP